MSAKNHWVTFVLISIAFIFIINLQSPQASTTPDVKFDGKQLSVHVSGVPLEQLLSMVEKHTGISFSYDDLAAETNVYANFENNSLVDGIRRILLQFNYAVIYNRLGHMETVLVLNRQRASSKNQADQTELYASQQQTDINDIPVTILGQEEAPPNAISIELADQEGSPVFSGQVARQGSIESDTPPEAKENVTPPPGEEQLAPVVDPKVTPPPGEEPLKPVVDTNGAPPPGEESLEQKSDADSIFQSENEEQAASEPKSKP